MVEKQYLTTTDCTLFINSTDPFRNVCIILYSKLTKYSISINFNGEYILYILAVKKSVM